jgi:glyoxylase-like metal-dependent hydrolase (beta-lactamase superfamily II)
VGRDLSDRKPDGAVRDGDELEVAGERLRVVHTAVD